MKISELMNELEKLMWQEGDVDVYVQDGCGCCEWPADPRVHSVLEDDEDRYNDPVGVYLN